MGGRRGSCVGNGWTQRTGVAKAMAPGGTGNNQQGLSITELMIAIAIAGIVMGGLYNVLLSQKKVLGTQDQDAEMHQAARAAMDAMVREFRMLGYGVPNSTWDDVSACPPANWDGAPLCPPAKIRTTPTDTSITFRGNLDGTRTTLANNHACVAYAVGSTIQCQTGSTTLTVDDLDLDDDGTPDFKVDDTIYVEGQTFAASPYSTHWHTATVTALNTGAKTLTINPGLNFQYVRGSTVHVVKIITYSFDNSGKQIQRCVSAAPPCGTSDTQPLVENINQLTLSYVFEDTGTGLPNDADGDTTNNTSNIRTINISVTARTPKPDPTYEQNGGYRQVTVTSQVTPRNLP